MRKIIGCLTMLVVLFSSFGTCFAEKYYPLKKGMTWEYTMITQLPENEPSQGEISIISLGERRINGKNTTALQFGNGYTSFIVEDVDGIYAYASQAVNDIEPNIKERKSFNLKYPLKIGTSWPDKATTFLLKWQMFSYIEDVSVIGTIEKTDDFVSVPAGNFENCIRVKYYGVKYKKIDVVKITDMFKVESYDWFAPNVGWIKSITKHNINDKLIGTRTFILKSFTK